MRPMALLALRNHVKLCLAADACLCAAFAACVYCMDAQDLGVVARTWVWLLLARVAEAYTHGLLVGWVYGVVHHSHPRLRDGRWTWDTIPPAVSLTWYTWRVACTCAKVWSIFGALRAMGQLTSVHTRTMYNFAVVAVVVVNVVAVNMGQLMAPRTELRTTRGRASKASFAVAMHLRWHGHTRLCYLLGYVEGCLHLATAAQRAVCRFICPVLEVARILSSIYRATSRAAKEQDRLRTQLELWKAAQTGRVADVHRLLLARRKAEEEEEEEHAGAFGAELQEALQIAADNGHPDCVAALLDARASVNVHDLASAVVLHLPDRGVKHPLFWAVKSAQPGCLRNEACVALLLERKASVGFDAYCNNFRRRTDCHASVLHTAVICGASLRTVQRLLEAGADVNHWSELFFRHPPLHEAMRHSAPRRVTRALLEAKAHVNFGSFRAFTPLHLAARHAPAAQVWQLLCAKADVDASTDELAGRDRPLHRVMIRRATGAMVPAGAPRSDAESLRVMKMLLDAGADANGGRLPRGAWPRGARPRGAWPTPLDFAVDCDKLDMVKLLLARGACPNSGHAEDTPSPVSRARSERVKEALVKAGGRLQ